MKTTTLSATITEQQIMKRSGERERGMFSQLFHQYLSINSTFTPLPDIIEECF